MTDKKDYALYETLLASCTLSPEEVAKILVKKPDVERQMSNIIKMARVFDAGAKDAERYSKQLENTIKQKDEYIEKLLIKIATLYLDQPTSRSSKS